MNSDSGVDVLANGESDSSCLGNIWDNYKWIIIAIIVLVVLVAGFYFYKKHKKGKVAPVDGTVAGAQVPITMVPAGGDYLDLVDNRN